MPGSKKPAYVVVGECLDKDKCGSWTVERVRDGLCLSDAGGWVHSNDAHWGRDRTRLQLVADYWNSMEEVEKKTKAKKKRASQATAQVREKAWNAGYIAGLSFVGDGLERNARQAELKRAKEKL